jgi:hypothetical protein
MHGSTVKPHTNPFFYVVYDSITFCACIYKQKIAETEFDMCDEASIVGGRFSGKAVNEDRSEIGEFIDEQGIITFINFLRTKI